MRKIRCAALLLLLTLICAAAAATVASAQDANKEVEVQLSLAQEKSIYRTGEPIRVILSFTAGTDGYKLNTTTTKPPSPIDEIQIAPASKVFHWLEEYSGGNRYSPDYASIGALSSTPTRVVLTLNDLFRFDQPGRYTVRVKTYRAARSAADDKSSWGKPLTLLTNEVSFEVKPMSEAEEEQEVLRLSSQLDVARDWRAEERITEELSYLTGDISTREKARRLLKTEGRSGNYFRNIAHGIYIARNRALMIKLLEDALRDPGVEVSQQLVGIVARLRVLQEKSSAAAAGVDKKRAAEDEKRRSTEILQAYVRELAASLQKRAGKSRTSAAITVLLLLPKEKAEAARMLASVREILLQEFDNLHPFSQEYLLRVYWEQLRDPLLVPAVERIVAQNNTPQGYLLRTTALKRLLELSRDRARPFIIAELRNPTSLVDFEVLSALEDPVLTEVDKDLLEQIRARAPLRERGDEIYLRHKTAVVARYASAAVYDELMKVYREFGGKWSPDVRGRLLGYFLRYKEKEVIPLVEQVLDELKPGQDSSFFLELTLTGYPDAVDAILQKRLAGNDPEQVSSAAYVMSKRGTIAGKQLIEARLNRWLNEWRGRSAELEADPNAVTQKMVQVNLIMSLMLAKSWKLSEEQRRQLQQACITDACRQHFHVR